jgi:hypothetical protein
MENSKTRSGDLKHSEVNQSAKTSYRVWLAVAFLIAVFGAQNIIEMRQESCSSDEVVHLPAGFTYLLKRDFRLNPEHPPLLKVLCALPLLVLHPKIDFTDPDWAEHPDQSPFGFRFLYSNNADQLLFWGRLPIVLLGCILGFFVFRWAQQLYGNLSGLFALGLYSFSPNVIAHSHFVTTDLGLTAFATISFYCLWRFLNGGKKRALYWSALAMGAALASKFSCVFFVPVALLFLWIFEPSSGNAKGASKDSAAETASKISKKGKGWKRRSERRIYFPRGFWRELVRIDRKKVVRELIFLGIALSVAQLAYLGSPDLSLYVKGLLQVNKNHLPFIPFYLHGSFALRGWWYYFIVTFLVKATAPFLILILLRIFLLFKNGRSDWFSSVFLLGPVLVIFVAVSALADALGVRYLLPIFPFLMIFSSGCFKAFHKKRGIVIGLWCLLGWHMASSLAAFPYSLSYFNEFVGGPSHGYRWLDDSSMDWGQELKQVKQFMDRKGISEITVSLFSQFDNPQYYGIHCYRPSAEAWVEIVKNPYPPPGVYVISGHWVARMEALGYRWVEKYPLIGHLGYSMYIFRVS